MITIPIEHIKAAILAAGNNSAHPYLCGVLVECMPGETRVVGADGDIVAIVREENVANYPHGKFIIPRQVVSDAIAQRPRPAFGLVTFEPDVETGKWIMNGTYRFDSLGSDYLHYRAAFAREVSGEAALFNPQLLAQFGKIARALGQNDADVTLHQNGHNNAMVSIYGAREFAGAIAPMNPNIPKAGRPGVVQWVNE